MRCVLCLVTALGLAATPEMSLTVEKLVTFVRSTVKLKQPDKQVADYLHHVKMVEKLDDQTIEDLQSLGAGPKTVAALKDLRDNSANLAVAPPPAPKPVVVPIPGPDSIEQGRIIQDARSYALNYTKQLPNFICVQVTRRDVDPTGSGNSWYHNDTIMQRVSYNEQHEDYQVVLVNNQPVTNVKMEQLGGTVSQGEFGSMMKKIFEPSTQTRFEWERWATLRGRRTYVFAYDVEQQHSEYHVSVDHSLDVIPAYRGLVYIDRDTKMITKITLIPYDLPATFPIRDIKTSLDYEFTRIGDQDYMLPIKAVITSSRSAHFMSKNEIEFRNYRKFGTETTIKFDVVPEPLSEEKTQEKPPQEKIKKP
jgi:hypothetical protein